MIQNKSSIKAILFSSSALILMFIGIESTLAQTDTQYQRNEQNNFSGNGSTGDINPFDTINKLIIAPSRTVDEFNEESSTSIQKAANEFKLQREKLLNSLSESSREKDKE